VNAGFRANYSNAGHVIEARFVGAGRNRRRARRACTTTSA